MSRATFLVLWISVTVAFTGWADNHKHIVRAVDEYQCASDSRWSRHPESLACTEDEKREVIRTNKEN